MTLFPGFSLIFYVLRSLPLVTLVDIKAFLSLSSAFSQVCVFAFQFFQVHVIAVEMSPVLLDTFCIADFVGLTVWPSVNAPSVLLAIAPLTLKHPSIRVVNCTIPITIVLFKVSMVNLAIRFIKIHSNSLLFSVFELAYVNSSVFKLVNAISIHRVQNKIALVNFAP